MTGTGLPLKRLRRSGFVLWIYVTGHLDSLFRDQVEIVVELGFPSSETRVGHGVVPKKL